MIILGIDPGLATIGYGVIQVVGDNFKKIDYGIISTSAKLDISRRLIKIEKEVRKLIRKYKPKVVACEDIFFYKNAKTAFSVGEARGVILLACAKEKVKVKSYTPLQIKLSVVGYGRAIKSQVQKMVKNILKLKDIPKPDDAADALAAALTCTFLSKNK